MSKMPLFFVLVVAVIVVAASFRYVQQRREKQANDAAPLLQKRVIVSNKREKVINDRRSRQQTVTPAGSEMRYEASFRPENGGLEVVFRLDAPQYHALSVGDRGMLSYKGTAFVSVAFSFFCQATSSNTPKIKMRICSKRLSGGASFGCVALSSVSCRPCIRIMKISATLTKIFSGFGKG